MDNWVCVIGNFCYVQVQTGEQDDVARSSDDEAEGSEAEELAETAIPEDTLTSLNLCPDDDEIDSDYASDYE